MLRTAKDVLDIRDSLRLLVSIGAIGIIGQISGSREGSVFNSIV